MCFYIQLRNSRWIHRLLGLFVLGEKNQLTLVTFHVVLESLFLLKRSSAQVAGIGLVLGVGPPDVAVVGGVRGEGLPAVLALEGPLSGVLADVCSQDAGGREGLEEEEEEEGRKVYVRYLCSLQY